MHTIKFSVKGYPQPKGSTRAFMPKGARYPIITADNPKTRPWARKVGYLAQVYAPAGGPWDGPVELHLSFWLKKPKSLPKTRRSWAIKKPDIDKLCRALLDSLTGVLFRDDSQVVSLHVWKDYGDAPGVDVEVINLMEFIKGKGEKS